MALNRTIKDIKFTSDLNPPNGYFLDHRSLDEMETKKINQGLGIFHPL
jgi:hypothetical protein